MTIQRVTCHSQYQSPNSEIIGSGPAGLYTAKKLLADINNISIHLYEKELVPTGLIRYGVGPDHQKIKKVGEEPLAT